MRHHKEIEVTIENPSDSSLPTETGSVNKAKDFRVLKWILAVLLVLGLIAWLWFTPPGFWGKLRAIGYAVCHQIPARSFHVHDQQVPLCVRCMGMYLGAFLGILFQVLQGKQASYPPRKVILIMAAFVLAFIVDGANSYIHFFPILGGLYQPSNTLRLVTGMGMGLAISAALVPAFHQTVWKDYQHKNALASWKQIGLLIVLATILTLLVLTEKSWIIAPTAVISALAVFMMLSMVYTIVWTMIIGKENAYNTVREMAVPFLGGALFALLQISAFTIGRYLLTGTWAGFNL